MNLMRSPRGDTCSEVNPRSAAARLGTAFGASAPAVAVMFSAMIWLTTAIIQYIAVAGSTCACDRLS